MASFNRVVLMGNITREFEVKYLPSGMAVTDIGLAVNDRRKTASGELVDEVTFVDITLFGRTAEIAGEYLTKGSQALIEGRLKLDTWETEGQKRSKLKVIGDRLVLVGGRSGGGGGGGGGRSSQPQSQQPTYDEGDYSSGPPEPQPAKRSPVSAGGSGGGGPPADEIPF